MKNDLKSKSIKKWLLIAVVLIALFGISFYAYFSYAFPKTNCDFGVEHLTSPDSAADCYECHKKATPKVAQDWFESKHGVMLVKCFVCHGQPDGKGSVPYALDPDVKGVCRKCHDPAMQRMEAKYGLGLECNSCHPFHQNSLHHEAYAKSESKQKL